MNPSVPPKGDDERWLIVPGKIFRFVFLISVALLIFYELSPDISHRPIGALTLADIFQWAFIAVISLGLAKWAFTPTTNEAATGWGYFALLSILGIAGLIVYAIRH